MNPRFSLNLCGTLLSTPPIKSVELSGHQTIYLDQIFLRLAFSAIKTAAQIVTHVLWWTREAAECSGNTHSRRGKNYFKFHMVSTLGSLANQIYTSYAREMEMEVVANWQLNGNQRGAQAPLYSITAGLPPQLVNHMKLWVREGKRNWQEKWNLPLICGKAEAKMPL